MIVVILATSDVRTLHSRFVVFEATAVLRHDLRNKLASVRNAAFYLKRRAQKDAPELFVKDPRVETFFSLTESELDATEAILAERLPKLPEIALAEIALAEVITDALRHVVAPIGVEVRQHGSDESGVADRAELAVAVLCLVENALESGARTVTVRAAPGQIEVVDDGPGVDDAAVARPGHLGLGLRIVKRIAGRAHGTLSIEPAGDRGVRATIAVSGVQRAG